MKDKFYRLADVMELTQLSRSTILRLENKGMFPKRIRLSERKIMWDINEFNAWMQEKYNTRRR
jgi:prophage regulatory protein